MQPTAFTINGCPVTVIDISDYGDLECAMCHGIGYHRHAVPWYYGPVREGRSEGGYKTVCEPCHDRWAAWNATPEAPA